MGLMSESLKDITIDEWLKEVQQHIQRFGGCRVSTEHIESITGSLVPFKMEASGATAFIILRSSILKDIVGTSVANRIAECALAEASGLQQPQAHPDLDRSVRQDLVQLLGKRAIGVKDLADHNEVLEEPTLKSRTSESIEMMRQHKTEQLGFLLTNNVNHQRSSGTTAGAVQLAAAICDVEFDLKALEDALVSGT